MEPNATFIRQIENDILDCEYKNFDAIAYNDDTLIPFLLKLYGDAERQCDSHELNHISEPSMRNFFYNMVQGISQCLRWTIGNEGKGRAEIPALDKWNSTILSFMKWGMDYFMVAQQFVAWSRGLLKAEISLEKKTISFIPLQTENYYFIVQQQFMNDKYINEKFDELPHDKINVFYKEWFREIERELATPPIINAIRWKDNGKSTLYSEIYSKVADSILPELSGETNLGGYTLADFMHFYTVLFINFNFVRWIEGLYDATLGVENVYGTNPMDLPLKQMHRFLSEITELTLATIENIVRDLIFDNKNFYSSLFVQPFVLSRTNRLYILPNLFAYIEPNRMLTGALNKGDKKVYYDRLINHIEKYQLNSIDMLLKTNPNWITFKEKKIFFKNSYITPDLILYDKNQQEILLIDYKHFLTPMSASEVSFRMKEIDKGIKQITKYVTLFKENLATINHQLEVDFSQFKIHAILLFYRPMPIPVPKVEDVVLTDLISLNQALTEKAYAYTVSELCNILASFKPEGLKEEDFYFTDLEVKAGDWTFTRKILVSDQHTTS